MSRVELDRTTLDDLLSLISDDEWSTFDYTATDGEDKIQIIISWPRIERRYYKRFNRLIKQFRDDREVKWEDV